MSAESERFLTLEAREFETRLNDPAVRWIHWWESQAESFHERLRVQQRPEAVPDALRRRVIKVLREMVRHQDPKVTEQALLALAQLQDPELADRILVSGVTTGVATPSTPPPPPLIEDPNPMIRRAAWLSLGLLDHPKAKNALNDPGTGQQDKFLDELSRVVAWGLSRSLNDETAQHLTKAVLNGDLHDEIRRMSLWTLRTHDMAPTKLIHGIARESRHPALVQQAILSISSSDEALLMVDIAGLTGSGRSIAVFKALDQYKIDHRADTGLPYANNKYKTKPRMLIYGSTPRTIEIEIQTAALLGLDSLHPEVEVSRYAKTLRRLAKNADVIGLISGRKQNPKLFDFSQIISNLHMLRGQAILSIAQISDGDDKDLDLLSDILDGDTQTLTGYHGQIPKIRVVESPTGDEPEQYGIAKPDTNAGFVTVKTPLAPARGFAAVGIGLLIARSDAQAPWSLGRRPEDLLDHRAERFSRQGVRDLAKAMRADHEPILLRSGAALGLGLSHRPEAFDILRGQVKRLKPGEELLAGYLALGLCLHGDPNGAKLGLKILDRTAPEGTPLAQAQRAAAQGLMLLGNPAAINKGLKSAAAENDPWVIQPLLRAAHTHLPDRDQLIENWLDDLPTAKTAHAVQLIAALAAAVASPEHRRMHRLTDRVNYAMTFDYRSNLLPRIIRPPHPLWTDRYWPTRDFYAISQPYLYGELLTR
ncbi:MAG: hypothetical protein AAGA25_11865 [Planctomycetota bacterium]